VPLDISNNVLAPPPEFHPASAGNDSIDPIASISQTGNYWKTSRTLSITYAAVDGVAIGRAEVRRYFRSSNASAWSAPTTVKTAPPDPLSDTFLNTVPADGFYRFEVQAWDQAGNTASNEIFLGVDTIPPNPALSLTGYYWRSTTGASLPFSVSDPGVGDLNHGVSQVRLYSATRPDNATAWTGWSQVATSSSSSGTFNVNVAVNQHTKFGIIARDTLGNEQASVVDMSVGAAYDSAAPGGSVNAAPYWRGNRTFTISYSASDNLGSDGSLRNITLWEQPRPSNGTCGAKTFVLASSSVFSGPSTRTVGADGHYCYSLYVHDKAGNGGVVQGFLGVDTVAPTAMASSSGPYWVTGSRTIHYEGADGLAVERVALEQSVSQDNVTFGTWGEISWVGPPYSKDFAWATGSEGFYRFRAVAYDRAGNSAPSTTIGLGDDSSPPSVSLAPESYWSGLAVNLTLNASDSLLLRDYAVYYAKSPDNATWSGETEVKNGTLTGRSVSLGVQHMAPGEAFYRYRAMVRDQTGKLAVSIAHVGVDDAVPAARVTVSGGYWNDSSPAVANLSYSAYDQLKLVRLVVYERVSQDNATWLPWAPILNLSAWPFNSSFDRNLSGEGHYEFAAVGYDASGKSTPLVPQARRGRDDAFPSSRGEVARFWNRGSFDILLEANDSLGLGRVTLLWSYSADNLSWGPSTSHLDVSPSGKSWSGNTTFSPKAEGFYRFAMRTYDREGKESTPIFGAGYDATAPRTSLTGLGNFTSSHAFGIAATADERLSGLAELELWYRKDAGSWIRYDSFPNTTVFFDSATTGGDGRYEFRAVGIDHAGNLEAKTSVDIATTVDTRAPAISGRSPDDGETNVPVNKVVHVAFSEEVRQSGNLTLADPSGEVPATVSWDADGRGAAVSPKRLLSPLTKHGVSVDGIEDLAGNAMAKTTWSFTTGDVPPTVVTTDPLNGSAVRAGRVEVRFSFSKTMEPATAGAVSTDRGKIISSDLASASLRVVFEFPTPGPATFRLDASKAKDSSGMLLDGDRDGAPGGDFVMVLEVVPGTGSIKGTVRSSSGAPLEGATVSIESNGSLVAANRTDAGGGYGFLGLAPGSYRVTASRSGFVSASGVVLIEAGKESVVDLSLVAEWDLAARFPGGALGLASSLVLLLGLLVLVALLLLRRRRKDRTRASSGSSRPSRAETSVGKDVRKVAERPPASSKKPQVPAPPPRPPVRADEDWREVERPAPEEQSPGDVEMETAVVHAGGPGARREEFGCPVCGHLVRIEEDECPGCGAEVNW
jgi:hypothetical protein